MKKAMTSKAFRQELVKVMPGYKWTVHKPSPYGDNDGFLEATGIQTSGFNRLSTLRVIRSERDSSVEYEVMSSGFGLKSPWLGRYAAGTLARALRGLQNHYEAVAAEYSNHAGALQIGRGK